MTMPNMEDIQKMIEANKAAMEAANAATPLRVDQLLPEELKDLEDQGRIKDGLVVPLQKQTITFEEARKFDAVPEMPIGVRERMEKATQVQSSFVTKTIEGVETRSADGGAAAEKPAPAKQPVNPDWAGAPLEDPVDADDRARFLATLLGADHFTKAYPLFGGKLVVTFRTRTAHEESIAANQAYADDKIDGVLPGSEAMQQARGLRLQGYQFAMSLISMQADGAAPRPFDYSKETGREEARVTSVRVALDKLYTTLPGPLLIAIRNAHFRFEQLVAKMVLAANDPSFWKAASAT